MPRGIYDRKLCTLFLQALQSYKNLTFNELKNLTLISNRTKLVAHLGKYQKLGYIKKEWKDNIRIFSLTPLGEERLGNSVRD